MYDILYVIGDSYTTPRVCVKVEDSYWKKFADLIKADSVINHSHQGKGNQNMLRNAMRFCLDNPNKKIFILIGLTTISRFDYQDYNVENSYNKNNGNHSELFIHNFYIQEDNNKTEEYDKWFVEKWTYEHTFCNLINSIIAHAYFFKSVNVDYLIHNCSTPLVEDLYSPFLKSFCLELKKDTCIPNLFANTYYSLNKEKGIKPVDFEKYGWHGHHGSEGNQVYFEYLKQVVEREYLTSRL